MAEIEAMHMPNLIGCLFPRLTYIQQLLNVQPSSNRVSDAKFPTWLPNHWDTRHLVASWLYWTPCILEATSVHMFGINPYVGLCLSFLIARPQTKMAH